MPLYLRKELQICYEGETEAERRGDGRTTHAAARATACSAYLIHAFCQPPATLSLCFHLQNWVFQTRLSFIMVPPAAEPITTAKISFVVDKKEQENDAPFDFVTRMDNNQTLLLRPYEIPVHDLRTHQEQGGETPTIENTGFCVRNWPYHADFQGQGWEEQYCKDGAPSRSTTIRQR